MKPSALTDRQKQIYTWIARRIESGATPTYREIGRQFEISSPNGVICHLRALEKKGLIQIVQGTSRCIRLSNRERTEELRQAVIDAAVRFVELDEHDESLLRHDLAATVEAYQRGTGK